MGGIYYLHMTQTRDAPGEYPSLDVLGVDLGICTVMIDSEGQPFTGSETYARNAPNMPRRAALQLAGTRLAGQRLKR